MDLKQIVHCIRNFPGLQRKQPIQEVFEQLRLTHRYGSQLPNFGDDAAVIPFGDCFLLLAADGMMRELLYSEPYAAGKAAVMVTVNDIYSMGGRPLGMVNVLASGDTQQRRQIVAGIEKGCSKLEVPMLGGHLHPDASAEVPSLSIAILGWANKVIRSHLAQAGDDLVLALDLDGRAGCRSVKSWDANSGKSSDQLLRRLEVLPGLAEDDLCCSGKDISNAGILGTISILIENSGKGGTIDLTSIPMPRGLSFLDWLQCFQSYGFILSVPSGKSDEVVSRFLQAGVQAEVIGKVTDGSRVVLQSGVHSEILFDFEQDRITGIKQDLRGGIYVSF